MSDELYNVDECGEEEYDDGEYYEDGHVDNDGDPTNFRFTLSESELAADSGVDAVEEEGQVAGITITPASAEQVETLFKRVAEIKVSDEVKEADEDGGFAMREKSPPPPKTGANILSVYPPPESKEVSIKPSHESDGSLRVMRYFPEGDLKSVAPHLSITFSAPMIQLGTVEDVANQTVPISLTPTPEGRWRWLGTKTVVFEPKYRFPLSTRYEVVIPSGTKAINGEVLAKEKRFWFATPTVKVVDWWPNYSAAKDTMFFVAFDQRIEPSAIFQTVNLEHKKKKQKYEVKLLDKKSVEANEELRKRVKIAQKDDTVGIRWIAFKSKKLLPYDSSIRVSIGPNIPSAEGPLKASKTASHTVRTYGPLTITYAKNPGARPNMELRFMFSNPLEEDSINVNEIEVSPPIPDLKATVVDTTVLSLKGQTKRGRYTFRFPQSIRDSYGQNLQPNQTAKVTVNPLSKQFELAHQGHFTFCGSFNTYIATCNVTKVRFVVKQLTKKDYLNSGWNTARRPGLLSMAWDFVKSTISNEEHTMDEKLGHNIGVVVEDKIIELSCPKDEIEITTIDLTPYLQFPDEELGHIAFGVEVVDEGDKLLYKRFVTAYGEATKIGFDAFHDNQRFCTWTTNLFSGAPLPGVTVESSALPKTITTHDGTAVIDCKAKDHDVLFATLGNDWTTLDNISSEYNAKPYDKVHAFTDRNLYKPKEEVVVKGYYRKLKPARYKDMLEILSDRKLNWVVYDGRRIEIAKGNVTTNDFGAFDFTFDIPDNANLGSGVIRIGKDSFTFEIKEFRRPEFKSTCTSSSGPHLKDGSAVVTASAMYYSGGNLPDAKVDWTVVATKSSYSPPKLGKYLFGNSEPNHTYTNTLSFSGKTDVSGSHNLLIKWDGPRELAIPITISAESTIVDLNNQVMSDSCSFIIHPSTLYVGGYTPKRFVLPNEELPVQLVVSDISGNLIGDVPIHIAYIKNNDRHNTKTNKLEVDRRRSVIATVQSSSSGHIVFPAQFEEPGSYFIELLIEDSNGRRNVTLLDVWVVGFSSNSKEEIMLQCDKKIYSHGDIIKGSVFSSLLNSEGLLLIYSDRMEFVKRFKLTGNNYSFEVAVPNSAYSLNIIVELLGENGVKAIFSQQVEVDRKALDLDVLVTPQSPSLKPGQSTDVNIVIKDSQGNVVPKAEIALFVVDDAILSLTGYNIPNPQSIFFLPSRLVYYHLHNRDIVKNIDPTSLLQHQYLPFAAHYCCEASGRGRYLRQRSCMMCKCECEEGIFAGGGGGGNVPPAPVEVRSNFNPLAHFTGSSVTDSKGSSTLRVTLPDTLTSYRIWAIACWSSDRFGIGESSIVAQLPLAVRPSIPRFLNFGDQSQVAVVISNQSQVTQNAIVGLRTHNVIHTGGVGFQVSIEAHKRALVRFPVMTKREGTAYFQFALSSAEFSDAVELKIPVWTPATTEAFATYGELRGDDVIVQPIAAPQDSAVFKQFGGLEITTSSTALSSLTDAFIYLVLYPYDCVEQLTSRALTTIALDKILEAFNVTGLFSAILIRIMLSSWVKAIADAQKDDGGFGWWKSADKSSPFITIHVAHLVQRLVERGQSLPGKLNVEQLKNYLRNIEHHFEKFYDPRTKNSLKAFALYVLHRFKEDSSEKAKALYRSSKDKIDFECLGWLLVAINDLKSQESKEIMRKIENSIVETAETAHFTTSYTDTGKYVFLGSERRTDGIILEALLDTNPSLSVIPALVRGLLAHKQKGRWGNTQENCFILLALYRYFTIYEKDTPSYTTRCWLQDQLAAEVTYKGRTTDSHTTKIAMKHIIRSAPENLNVTISKEGTGMMYYRLGINYAPNNLVLKALDQGFEIIRTYEAVDDASHVVYENGIWKIKAGERIRVRLIMTTVAIRYHVALVDKLPAGFEPVNPSLKGSQSLPKDPKAEPPRFWYGTWFEHQNFRDERVEAFAGLLYPGSYNYSYIVRTTSKGIYTAPPAYAEEMYSPEVFGRSQSETVQII